jgi:molybdenum ABC transporter, periplasmic molybdate-binding protein
LRDDGFKFFVKWTLKVALLAAICGICCKKPERPALTVAAAANLTGVFEEIGRAFTKETGIRVVFSYGSTAQLAQQIENAAPFDVFAAADTEHVDQLIGSGKILRESRVVYARGQLALWDPRGVVREVADLSAESIRFVAIAKPEAAPYGAAAVESLKRLGIWEKVQPKVVYASNINTAKQYASTGNADAAFTAFSLVLREKGRIIVVDERLHRPIDQAVGIVAESARRDDGQRFISFLSGEKGRGALARFGYLVTDRGEVWAPVF